MTLQPHEQRVVDEKSELDAKLKKLDEFIETSPIFLSLSPRAQSLLYYQGLIMTEYSNILDQRISEF